MNLLLLLIVTPLLFAIAMPLVPAARARTVGIIGTLIPVAIYAYLAMVFPWQNGADDQLTGSYPWIPSLGLSLSLGADTVSMLLAGLTVLLGPICVWASFTAINERVKTYYGWLLALQAAMTGVFLARDLIVFFVCFEFTLVPLYILINLYGSTNRKAAATRFFLYTFTGSIITLAGLVYVAWYHVWQTAAAGAPEPSWTFDFDTLRTAALSMPLATQAWVFGALMLGFSIKVPLFPVHTWLPLAHTEAPTAGSVILAGVLLKLGTYGMFRFALGFTPAAAVYYAPLIGVLAVIGIIYAGLICWVQTDVKKLVAYSSVSHLGFCVLGLFAFSSIGVSGSILYMINHGLSTGALFLLIGMMYERYHTRSMKELGGLAARMPVWATFMIFFTMASVGLPGLNGFVSEFMCLLGTFQAGPQWAGVQGGMTAGIPGELGPWLAAIAGIGMIITAMYLLYMVGRIVWGPISEPHGHGRHGGHDEDNNHRHAHGAAHEPALPRDLGGREIGLLLPLAALCLLLGLYPTPVLRVLEGPAQDVQTQMAAARMTVPAAGSGEMAAADAPAAAVNAGSGEEGGR